ncbi:hypothetical protein KC640_00315, partial [Candidatus Dojkabacteria bacterium]|nr:hypothetical protein [Candidatus Dojkabacteria bacterium]
KSGQGTAVATYHWSTVGEQVISVTVQNTGGSASAQLNVNVGCADGEYLAEYFSNKTLSGNPISYVCEQQIDADWGSGGPIQIPSTSFNLGNGWDGAINVGIGQTAYTDNIKTKVLNTAAANQNTICVASTLGLGIGDEIMVVQSMGTGAGNYEFATIANISSCWLTLLSNLQNTYTTPNSAAQVIRIPHYTDVIVSGTLTIHPWDGETGGVMAFRATGDISLNGGIIDVTGKGFRGGTRTYGAAVTGLQGEGLNGLGTSNRGPNEPGGGGGGPGTVDGGAGAGGGAYRTAGGTAKDPFYGDPGIGSSVTYGDSILSKMYFGGAGGAGGTDDSGWNGQSYGGAGGSGGGIMFISANQIKGNGAILGNGGNGEDHNGVADSEHGGGGGGGGGSVKLLVDKINVDGIVVTTTGGAGGKAKDGNAGSGGSGQSYIEYCSKLGASPLPGNAVQLTNCDKDNFSVRWTGRINFTSTSNYNISAIADDGVRVFLNSDQAAIIDSWTDGYHSETVTRQIDSGLNEIKVEYYEATGAAEVHIGIQDIGMAAPILDQIPDQTIDQGGSFSEINLNDYVTNLADQPNLNWHVEGNHTLQVSIANGIATISAPPAWSGSEYITFVARNAANQEDSSSAHFTVNGPVVCASGKFKAEYFNNIDLSGVPAMSRCEDKVDYVWDYGGPDPIINIDNFSVRWTTTLHVSDESSIYTFSATTDDGVRLYVDQNMIIDNWIDQGATTVESALYLAPGNHTVVMDYYEKGGAAVAKLEWQLNHAPIVSQIPGQTILQGNNFAVINLGNYVSDADGDQITWTHGGNASINVAIAGAMATLTYPNGWNGSEDIMFIATDPFGASASSTARFTVQTQVSCQDGTYLARYYSNPSLVGSPTMSRCETSINYNWRLDSPAAGLPVDGFSVQWVQNMQVPVDGTYEFTTTTDLTNEGVRLYIDDVLQIDYWPTHSATGSVRVHLGAGMHLVRMEYFDNQSVAMAILSSKILNKPPIVGTIPGQIRAQGQGFTPINLASYGSDPDGDPLVWTYSGNKDISVAINGSIATLTFPGGWTGKEDITFTATDSHGATASSAPSTFVVKGLSSCASGQYLGQYYNNTTLSGEPVYTTCETIPNFDWGKGSPGPGINTDNFSIRWTAIVNFAQDGEYLFTTSSDGGVRLYINDHIVIDNWDEHMLTDDQTVQWMPIGRYPIKLEYYDGLGNAVIKLGIRANN